MADPETINPLRLNAELRELLEGCRMVCECEDGLIFDGSAHAKAKSVFARLVAQESWGALEQCDAAVAFYLAYEGVYRYESGAFWTNLSVPIDRSTEARVRQAWESAVASLGLESFAHVLLLEPSRRFVTPILLHGGIPESQSREFAGQVVAAVWEGQVDAEDMVGSLLRRHDSRAGGYLSSSADRLLRYGGDFAYDLVQRMIGRAIGDDATPIVGSLPAYLADHVEEQVLVRAEGGAARKPAMPRPSVWVERHSPEGPFLRLPDLSEAGGRWRVGTSLVGQGGRELDLYPDQCPWPVRLEDSAGRDLEGTVFAGSPSAAIFIFNSAGRLMVSQDRIGGPEALVAVPASVTLTDSAGRAIEGGNAPRPLRGAWEGWRLLDLGVADLSEVHVVDELGQRVRLPVVQPPPKPALVGDVATGAVGPGGCPIYAAVPQVEVPDRINGQPINPKRWTIRWTADGDSPGGPRYLTSLTESDGRYALSDAIEAAASEALCGNVEVFGPLGSDFRERIAVIPGFDADIPNRPAAPDAAVQVPLKADCGFTVAGRPLSFPYQAVFDSGVRSIQIEAGGVPIKIEIPRIEWAITEGRDSDDIAYGYEPAELTGPESLSDVRVHGRWGTPESAAIELVGGDTRMRVPAPDGASRWTFLANSFSTTVSQSLWADMALRLVVGDTAADVAYVKARYEPGRVEIIESAPDEEGGVNLAAIWDENAPFHGRRLRLWPISQPWEPPAEAAIPDDDNGEFCGLVPDARPGPQLAEITLGGQWRPVVRPHADAASLTVLTGPASHRGSGLMGMAEAILAGEQPAETDSFPLQDNQAADFAAALTSCASDWTSSGTFNLLASLLDGPASIAAIICTHPPRFAASDIEAMRFRMLPIAAARTGQPMGERLADRLWSIFPPAAALLDVPTEESSDRWVCQSGWDPQVGAAPWQPPEPFSGPMGEFGPDRLRQLSDALPPAGRLPLSEGGYRQAAFEMLARTADNRNEVNQWQSATSRLRTHVQRLDPALLAAADNLLPEAGRPGWESLPRDLMVVANHLHASPSPDDRLGAAEALAGASAFAPRLVVRSVLAAVGTAFCSGATTAHQRTDAQAVLSADTAP